MAHYTTQLRSLIENNFDLQLNEYPIFSEDYRETLNQKIIDHYYFSEIGFETAGLFRHRLKTKLNEIMPYYNQLYSSQLLEISPLLDFEETTEETKSMTGGDSMTGTATDSTTDSGSTSGTSSATSSTSTTAGSLNVSSDTPQGFLSIGSIESNTYASEAQQSEDTGSSSSQSATTNGTTYQDTKSATGSSSSTTTKNQTDTLGRHYYGFRGKSQAELLKIYRETFINIDMMIINELADLFMLVY